MTWVLGFVIMSLMSMIAWNGNRMVTQLDNMNTTQNTMLIHQQDVDRRVIMLEADNIDNKEHWQAHEEFTRRFLEEYDLRKKK